MAKPRDINYGRVRWAAQYGTFYKTTSSYEEFLNGTLKINIFPAIRVDPDHLHWDNQHSSQYPQNNPTWRLYYHSLVWLSDFLLEAMAYKDPVRKTEIVERVIATVKSWAKASEHIVDNREGWNGHCVAMRLTHLLFLRTWADEAWLHTLITTHAGELVNTFSGYWNHGLAEATALYGAGQEMNVPQWTELGRERILDCIEVMVDDQGSTNEQAPGYSGYVYRLIRASKNAFDSYDDEASLDIATRLNLLETFTLHSLAPNKRYIPIGDSYPDYPMTPTKDGPLSWFAKPGLGGTPPQTKTAIYQRGYAFSRRHWGVDELARDNTYLTVRFGPGRTAVHGHEDASSVTLWSHDRHIIIDSGHVGYEETPLRRYLQSTSAHNVLEIKDAQYHSASETQLYESWVSEDESQIKLSTYDEAFELHGRQRNICFFHGGPLFVLDSVYPTAMQPTHIRQLWHLSPEFLFQKASSEAALFESVLGDLKVYIVSFEILAEPDHQSARFNHWRGSEEPLIGWSSAGHHTATPTSTLGVSFSNSKPALVTAVIPAKIEDEVSWSLKPTHNGYSAFRVHRGGEYYAVNVAHEPARRQSNLNFR